MTDAARRQLDRACGAWVPCPVDRADWVAGFEQQTWLAGDRLELPPQSIVWVQSGMVGVALESESARCRPLGLAGAGGWICVASASGRLSKSLKPVWVAHGKLTAWSQPLEGLRTIRGDWPLELLCQGESTLLGRLAGLRDATPPFRLGALLSNLAHDALPHHGHSDAIELPVAQLALASACGLSRTTCSALLQVLTRSRWLSLERGQVTLLKIGAWSALRDLLLNVLVGGGRVTSSALLDALEHAHELDLTRRDHEAIAGRVHLEQSVPWKPPT